MPRVTIDGQIHEAGAGERLIDLFNRRGVDVPHVCYHPQLGPIQTCDTCLVEVDGALVRACATRVDSDIAVSTTSAAATAAQLEAFDRILGNHLLYCTVCDNNNGNCTVHNTTKLLGVEHQRMPFRPKPYAVDHSNPFYRYDPDQCIVCGRCVEACQNVQVNETLSIRWEDPHPRVLWDGGAAIGESSCVSCGHCVTVCPCNALLETTMLGHAGFMTALPTNALPGLDGPQLGAPWWLATADASRERRVCHRAAPSPASPGRSGASRSRRALSTPYFGPRERPRPRGCGNSPLNTDYPLRSAQVLLDTRSKSMKSACSPPC